MKELRFENVMQVPRFSKVVINIGLGEAMDNPKALEAASGDLEKLPGKTGYYQSAPLHCCIQTA
jgi:large subunit ribosomal protein L5